jgi:hypothetical protein
MNTYIASVYDPNSACVRDPNSALALAEPCMNMMQGSASASAKVGSHTECDVLIHVFHYVPLNSDGNINCVLVDAGLC